MATTPVVRLDRTLVFEMLRESDGWRWSMDWTISPDGMSFRGTCRESVGVRNIVGRRLGGSILLP